MIIGAKVIFSDRNDEKRSGVIIDKLYDSQTRTWNSSITHTDFNMYLIREDASDDAHYVHPKSILKIQK